MTDTAPTIILTPQMTRAGLNKLLTLELPGGIAEAITHVGLTAAAFTVTAELSAIPNEIDRWPVLDGEEIENEESPQFNLYLEYPYEGNDTAVRGFGFYLADGTLLAAYSAPQAEAYLSKRFMLDSFIHLILDGAPGGSVTVVNTGVRFNPGVRETLLQLMEHSLDKTLRLHELSESQRLQDEKLVLAENDRSRMQQQIDQQQIDMNTLRIENELSEAANFDLLAGNQLFLEEKILDLRLQEVAR